MNRIVLVESPFAAPTPEGLALNARYLRACLRDCLVNRNEAPFASHAIYTLPGVLRDDIPRERVLGMEAGWEFLRIVEGVVVYKDLGISRGMAQGIERAMRQGLPVEHRNLGEDWFYRALMREACSDEHDIPWQQRFDFAYGNLVASTRHKPTRGAFLALAESLGVPLAEFDRWAEGRQWTDDASRAE